MDNTRFQCPHCNYHFTVLPERLNQTMACPSCGENLALIFEENQQAPRSRDQASNSYILAQAQSDSGSPLEQDPAMLSEKNGFAYLAFAIAIIMSPLPGKDLSGMGYTIGYALSVWIIAGAIPGLLWLITKLLRKQPPLRTIYITHSVLVFLLGHFMFGTDLSQAETRRSATADSHITFSADTLLDAFPLLSVEAREAFKQGVTSLRLSEAEAGALLWQLMAEGETLLSKADTDEMVSFYWKAIETLPPEDQAFLIKVNMKVSQGGGYSAIDQHKSKALVQQGFANLSSQENDRFIELRTKSIELALLSSTN